jgi:hypothetical protein
LINNRQGGRRRGRGGQRGQNLGGQPGNRQDNRQRGNAAQLLEKYKSMARDSQLAGDRVQTEYFLQFADHYFRVLSESRARFDEQNPNQRRHRDDDGDEDSDGGSFNEADQQHGDEELVEAGDDESGQDEDRQERHDRPARGPRRQRGEREPRQFNRDERSAADNDEPARARPHLNGGGDSLPLDVLPPAIGSDDADEEAAAPRPRRRSRAARPADGDEEIAPAA